MPSPYHECAHIGCEKMIAPQSTHCRNHIPRTKEWIEKQAATQRGKTVSPETRKKISLARSNRIPKTCQWCGANFSVKPSRDAEGDNYGKFCSMKCVYKSRSGKNSRFWAGGKQKYTCKQCGGEIFRQKSHAKGINIFCSHSCNSIYKKSYQKNKHTNIEIAMAQALTDAGLDFQEQMPLCNVTVTDFYLPHFRLAIFCDGDYWHNYPHGKPRDLVQTKTLQENEYIVLRFWGSEINSNISNCIQKIRDITG